MGLTFSGASADGGPADQVRDVLRNDRVQKFRGGGHALPRQVQKQGTGKSQARVDVIGMIQVRIVDQALPAHGCAGLLEIDTHDHLQLRRMAFTQGSKAPGVVTGGINVMD